MTVIGERTFDDVVKLPALHPHRRQAARQAKAGIHVGDGFSDVSSALQTHRAGHAVESVSLLHRHGLGIEAHHRRQKHRVQGAVVQAGVNAALAVAERMHADQAFLKRHRALHRRAHQIEPCLAVAAVAGGAFDVGPAALQAVEGDAVRWRVEGGGHEGFHAVRNRVHAGRRCEPGWQAEREFGVANRGFRHQVPAVEAEFSVVVQNDDGTACDFAAGAAGGRHGDQRRGAVGYL